MRKYYKLPPALGKFAVEKYKKVKEDAVKAKKEFLEKEKAIALLRVVNTGQGLIYETPVQRSGFTVPKEYAEYYLIKPKKNTLIGKRVQKELDEVCEKMDNWEWCIERALNLEESIYEHQMFHMTICRGLPDGSVLVSQHRNAKHNISDEHKITLEKFEQEKEEAL